MKIAKNFSDIVLALAVLQWTYILTMLGYQKWGWLGGIAGFLFSAPLLPLSPFSAWYLFPTDQVFWFYGFCAAFLVSLGVCAFLRPPIVSEYPFR